jgi:hypothetical protein
MLDQVETQDRMYEQKLQQVRYFHEQKHARE